MRYGLGLIFAGVLACGGSSSGGDLDTALNGTWAGPVTLTLAGQAPQAITGQVQIAVSGQNATVTEVCLDGSGSITAHGSGKSASWTGSYACPAIPFSNCSSVVMTFQSASATLNGTTLTAHAAGVAAGCGGSQNFTIDLTGTKQ